MNKQKTLLGSSVSVLIVTVIAILAFVRGKLLAPLLILAFVLWGLWLVWKLLLPAWREVRRQRENAIPAAWTPVNTPVAPAADSATLTNLLLLHVNHRISGCLMSYYPNAKWEWRVSDPARFVVTGGTGRIRVYGIPNFDYADIKLDQKARIDILLLNIAPLSGTSEETPEKQPLSPQVWFETQGKETLERMVMELNSKGHSKLYLKEDGNICIQQEDGGEEASQGSFQTFPEKVYWPGLVEVLRQNGLAATVMEHCIQVAW